VSFVTGVPGVVANKPPLSERVFDNCVYFSVWEKLLGGFLALGVSGIVGVTFLVVFLCTGICITVCACTCCKKQCQCLYKCCKSVKPGGNKVGVAEDDGTRMSGVKSSGSGVRTKWKYMFLITCTALLQ
jgi:hypothetical protein